jgi:hypothetical protein
VSDAQPQLSDNSIQQSSTSYSTQGEDSQANMEVRLNQRFKYFRINEKFCLLGCATTSFGKCVPDWKISSQKNIQIIHCY